MCTDGNEIYIYSINSISEDYDKVLRKKYVSCNLNRSLMMNAFLTNACVCDEERIINFFCHDASATKNIFEVPEAPLDNLGKNPT